MFTFQVVAHIAQGGRPIEKWLRNQIFMEPLPLFRDQLALTFVRLLRSLLDILNWTTKVSKIFLTLTIS